MDHEEVTIPCGVVPLGFTHQAQINYLDSFTGHQASCQKKRMLKKNKCHFFYPAALQVSRTGELPKLAEDAAPVLTKQMEWGDLPRDHGTLSGQFGDSKIWPEMAKQLRRKDLIVLECYCNKVLKIPKIITPPCKGLYIKITLTGSY